jgi:hypothetical protein
MFGGLRQVHRPLRTIHLTDVHAIFLGFGLKLVHSFCFSHQAQTPETRQVGSNLSRLRRRLSHISRVPVDPRFRA